MERLAPQALACDWDNVGLQVGNYDQNVSKILVTLSVTEQVATRATEEEVDLIIAHHPLVFRPLKNLRTDTPIGRILATIIKHDIAVYVSHTNLDQSPSGLNQWLADQLKLNSISVLSPLGEELDSGLGRVGLCEPVVLQDLADRIGVLWGTKVRICGDPAKTCQKIAVCGGSGGSLVSRASFVGADVLITGDIGYHDALEAVASGLALIDATHFGTEKLMVPKVAEYLRQELPECIVLEGLEGNNPFV